MNEVADSVKVVIVESVSSVMGQAPLPIPR